MTGPMGAGPSRMPTDELKEAVEALMSEIAKLDPQAQDRIAKQIKIIKELTGVALPELERQIHFPHLPVW